MEANEMEAGTRDQGGQTLQELEGRHDEMGSAVRNLIVMHINGWVTFIGPR